MRNSYISENQYIKDVMFVKEMIKSLEDTIFNYYHKNHFDVLPLIHKAYDNLSLTLYRLQKENNTDKNH